MKDNKNKVLIITGPTAVGKTEISIRVAQELDGEIICMDSRQIYKNLKIGTSFPDEQTLKLVKHHLFGFVELDEHFTAYDYKLAAEKTIEEVLNNNKFPILVGGTGLYIDALQKGFLNVESDHGVRTYLRKLENENPGILRKMLTDIDPESALRIHPNDVKRTIRALEVYIVTGKRMGELIKFQGPEQPKFNYEIVVLDRDRKELHERINQRTEKMLKEGLIEEVNNILSLGFSKNLNSLNTIGYKEVIKYLEGEIEYDTMVHKMKVNTRNYARRQIIYFRRFENSLWLNLSELSEEDAIRKIILKIKQQN
ncbi:MAG TPA: tRNA (adenosine(37)-N6)-dimethylallyltransferase MiaA [Defluviitoga sp.]|nr:tRNA (adenosine(37)-N6)-dimethylallyltransferase MiaA [Defluviitoga sp.]HOP24867.1 tRNA (adenosine(37)-N6)-dimethylallyltransferase MiaA [Defluviitoga sp.]HPZ28762.1 tRNA (adenosine(37)-N6)-dimethylallyltransferase MiaA [Defluviitoga sp.]HQD62895.1 tRNA (adenosine(37)-N6)-dimethylallyltransferase MiaA [Defluviitoga sp.]